MRRTCAEAGHEIGYHGLTHTRADAGWTGEGWDRDQEAETLDRTLDLLERLTGQRPRGHCFEHSPHTIDMLLERGFLYSNCHQADDIPYWWYRNGQPTRLLALPFDWSMSDSTQSMRIRAPWAGQPRSPDAAYENWRAEFDGIREFGRYFLLTKHPEWTDRGSRILALERLLQHILSQEDVWWATTREVAEYWHRTHPPATPAVGGLETPS
jgi:peptidoglycan/xylan/chitin deacetylase (PgdA/CDA1 family)